MKNKIKNINGSIFQYQVVTRNFILQQDRETMDDIAKIIVTIKER